MHKNVPVVDIAVEPDGGYISKIGVLHSLEHLPIGTAGRSSAEKDRPNRAFLNEWLAGRSIPATRDGLGIPGVEAAIGKMLALDYIIANEDRHYNNFGFARNAETLEWLGLAPVYDSGTSLWHNTPHIGLDAESKPFRKTHDAQIKLAGSLKWFDFDSLKGLADECEAIFAQSPNISRERRSAISKAIMERAGQVDGMAPKNRA